MASIIILLAFFLSSGGPNAVNGDFCPQWISGGFPIQIGPASSPGQCLDVPGVSFDDNVRIDSRTCFDTATNELWLPIPTDSCYFYLVAQHSGKCLTSNGDGTVVQWECVNSTNQQWLFWPASQFQGTKALMLDRRFGQCIQKQEGGWRDGTLSRQVTPSPDRSNCEAFTTPNCNLLILPNVPMQLSLDLEPTQCMEVMGASQENGAVVNTWGRGPFANEQWTAIPTDSCYVILKVTHTGKVLTANSDGSGLDVPLVQWDNASGPHQQWIFELVGEHRVRIYELRQGSCIQRIPGTSGDGAGLQLTFPRRIKATVLLTFLQISNK